MLTRHQQLCSSTVITTSVSMFLTWVAPKSRATSMALDTANLSLSDDALGVVSGRNARFDPDYQSALANPVRVGEPLDFPNGCLWDGTPE
jgi:hypothetical protein